MDAKQLRIGNLFQDEKGNILTCFGVTDTEHENDGIVWYDKELGFYLSLNECFEIKLTKEILLNVFNITHTYGMFTVEENDEIWLELDDDGRYYITILSPEYAGSPRKEIKYVHQWQNAYYFWTDKELTFKQ